MDWDSSSSSSGSDWGEQDDNQSSSDDVPTAVATSSTVNTDIVKPTDAPPDQPTEKDTPVKEKIWERPWSIDEIRKGSKQWSLAGDAGLLKHLQKFSQDFIQRTHDVKKSMDQLVQHTSTMDCKVNNCFNDFQLLANTQFMENRIEEDESELQKSVGKTDSMEMSQEKTKEEKERELIPVFKECFKLSLDVYNTVYKPSTEDDVLELCETEYSKMPMPYIIGSYDFDHDDLVGLGPVFEKPKVDLSSMTNGITDDEPVYSDDEFFAATNQEFQKSTSKAERRASSPDLFQEAQEDLFTESTQSYQPSGKANAKPKGLFSEFTNIDESDDSDDDPFNFEETKPTFSKQVSSSSDDVSKKKKPPGGVSVMPDISNKSSDEDNFSASRRADDDSSDDAMFRSYKKSTNKAFASSSEESDEDDIFAPRSQKVKNNKARVASSSSDDMFVAKSSKKNVTRTEKASITSEEEPITPKKRPLGGVAVLPMPSPEKTQTKNDNSENNASPKQNVVYSDSSDDDIFASYSKKSYKKPPIGAVTTSSETKTKTVSTKSASSEDNEDDLFTESYKSSKNQSSSQSKLKQTQEKAPTENDKKATKGFAFDQSSDEDDIFASLSVKKNNTAKAKNTVSARKLSSSSDEDLFASQSVNVKNSITTTKSTTGQKNETSVTKSKQISSDEDLFSSQSITVKKNNTSKNLDSSVSKSKKISSDKNNATPRSRKLASSSDEDLFSSQSVTIKKRSTSPKSNVKQNDEVPSSNKNTIPTPKAISSDEDLFASQSVKVTKSSTTVNPNVVQEKKKTSNEDFSIKSKGNSSEDDIFNSQSITMNKNSTPAKSQDNEKSTSKADSFSTGKQASSDEDIFSSNSVKIQNRKSKPKDEKPFSKPSEVSSDEDLFASNSVTVKSGKPASSSKNTVSKSAQIEEQEKAPSKPAAEITSASAVSDDEDIFASVSVKLDKNDVVSKAQNNSPQSSSDEDIFGSSTKKPVLKPQESLKKREKPSGKSKDIHKPFNISDDDDDDNLFKSSSFKKKASEPKPTVQIKNKTETKRDIEDDIFAENIVEAKDTGPNLVAKNAKRHPQPLVVSSDEDIFQSKPSAPTPKVEEPKSKAAGTKSVSDEEDNFSPKKNTDVKPESNLKSSASTDEDIFKVDSTPPVTSTTPTKSLPESPKNDVKPITSPFLKKNLPSSSEEDLKPAQSKPKTKVGGGSIAALQSKLGGQLTAAMFMPGAGPPRKKEVDQGVSFKAPPKSRPLDDVNAALKARPRGAKRRPPTRAGRPATEPSKEDVPTMDVFASMNESPQIKTEAIPSPKAPTSAKPVQKRRTRGFSDELGLDNDDIFSVQPDTKSSHSNRSKPKLSVEDDIFADPSPSSSATTHSVPSSDDSDIFSIKPKTELSVSQESIPNKQPSDEKHAAIGERMTDIFADEMTEAEAPITSKDKLANASIAIEQPPVGEAVEEILANTSTALTPIKKAKRHKKNIKKQPKKLKISNDPKPDDPVSASSKANVFGDDFDDIFAD